MREQRGQVALLLILAMAVVGAISVSVASRSIEGLRTVELEKSSTSAFKAAEAGLEQAILNKSDVSGSLSGGGVSYNATYNVSGQDGFVAAGVPEGDVVTVSLVGAVSGGPSPSIYVYWNGNAAVKVTDLQGDPVTANYAVKYYTSDPNTAGRNPGNNFTSTTDKAGYVFKNVHFDNRQLIPVSFVAPPSNYMRVLLLYQDSDIGIQPVNVTLAAGQVVSVSSEGTTGTLKSRVTQNRFTQNLPSVFDNVLYTNQSLAQ